VEPVLECVPNFSEGRDLGKIRQIILALRQPGVMLLDYSADRDHNRMVVTVAGPPDAVVEGAVRAVGKAAELIDLREHRGVHPRMGAADVVPFVPIQGITLERAAALARLAGREIHRRYGVPVFFYESAAERDEMRRLENVRRGQFEGTAALGKLPDLGGELHATAGAAIVGARKFLVAYNLLLETADVSIAKKIARQVRQSGGGLKSVKALGVQVRGRAQVTVNVTNFHEAPVERVFERVKELAAEFGTRIHEGELIGLVPEAALAAGTEWTRVIAGYSPETKVLERRLARPMEWPEA
jgi:glutamate formiminotransferase / 5-formyltetrahydrofolate cyclo-ligase